MRGAGMDTATVQHSTTPLPQDTTDRPITPVEFIVTFAEIRARSRLILQRPQQQGIRKLPTRRARPTGGATTTAQRVHRQTCTPISPERAADLAKADGGGPCLCGSDVERCATQTVTAGVVSLGIKAFFPVARSIGSARALKRATQCRTIE
jgi:hypothetical protein